MFYKILFLLACYNMYRSIKVFIKENVTVTEGKNTEVSMGAYISLAMISVFYVMVIAICCAPSLLFGGMRI